jgi:hypothetical protein
MVHFYMGLLVVIGGDDGLRLVLDDGLDKFVSVCTSSGLGNCAGIGLLLVVFGWPWTSVVVSVGAAFSMVVAVFCILQVSSAKFHRG